jgi:hypothetical protein
MENKLVIAIATLMVVALAAPVVMAAEVSYSATVGSGQSTSVTASDGAFDNVNAGSDFADNVKENSITCQNVGNAAASVAAKFTSSVTASTAPYGLVSGTDVIGGSNFQLGDSTFNTLNDAGTDVTLTDGVPAASTVTYDAKLQVPSGQTAGVYGGTVQLTFS